MPNYNYRRITPDDQLVFDASNNLVGIRSGHSSGSSLIPSSVSEAGNLKSRILSAIASPEAVAYRSKLCLLFPPAWTTKIYSTGDVVQNSGNIYLAQNSTGTGTTAPTATTDGPITDGTIRWLYMGPVSSFAAPVDEIPDFSYGTTPAACNRKYDFSHNGTVFNAPDDVGSIWLTGATFGKYNAYGYANGGFGATAQSQTAAIDFCTDAPIVAFNTYANFAAGHTAYIQVDGYPLFPFGSINVQSDLLPGGIVLDWTTKALKTRRIRVWCNNDVVTGIGVPRTYRVWQPRNPMRYRLCTEGDSTMANATPGNGGYGRPWRLGAMLGCDDVWDVSAGGTGFLAGGANTLISRIPAIAAINPEILYIAPTLNDSSYSSAQRVAAYIAYFQALYAVLPNVRVVLGTGWVRINAADTGATSSYAIEQDFITALAALNNPKISLVKSVTGDGGAWLTGDGNITTTTNANHGNTDRLIGMTGDTLHPNQRGLEYLMWRDYYAICEAVNGFAL